MANKEDLAWLGGFFDGEGCITIGRPNGYYSGTVGVGNSRPELLRRCLSIVSFFDIPQPGEQHFKGTITLQWSKYSGTRLLLLLRPYICHSKQKRRAEIYCRCFDGTKHRALTEHRDVLWEEWQSLNSDLKIERLEQHLAFKKIEKERTLTPRAGGMKRKSYLGE